MDAKAHLCAQQVCVFYRRASHHTEERINLIIFCPVGLRAPDSLASHLIAFQPLSCQHSSAFFNDDCVYIFFFFFFFFVVSYSSGGTIRDGEEPFICPGPSWRYMTWIIGLLLFLFPKSNRKLFGTNVSPHFAISSMVLDIKTPRPRSSPPADSSLSFSSTAFEKIFSTFFSAPNWMSYVMCFPPGIWWETSSRGLMALMEISHASTLHSTTWRIKRRIT